MNKTMISLYDWLKNLLYREHINNKFLSPHEYRIRNIMKILNLHDEEKFIINENEDYIYCT